MARTEDPLNRHVVRLPEQPGQAAAVGGTLGSVELREAIDRTRLEMDETIEALAGRLHPSSLLRQGVEAVERVTGESPAGRAVQAAVRSAAGFVRHHPLAASLAFSVALGLLLGGRRRG